MSAYVIVCEIEKEARTGKNEPRAFHLELQTVSGRQVTGAVVKSESRFLKLLEPPHEPRTTYLAWEAIEQVTPIWL